MVDVRGVYFFPGKSGSRRQKSAIRKLSVIGFDADHTFGEGKTRSRGRVGEGEGGRAPHGGL